MSNGNDEIRDRDLEALAAAVATEPPPDLRERALRAVRARQELERTRRSLGRWRSAAGVASLAAVLLLALLAAGSGAPPEDRDLLAELAAQDREIVSRGKALQVHAEIVRILSSATLRTAALEPEAGREGSARVLMDTETGAVALVGTGLPPAEPGQLYELWALRGERPERVGEFQVDPGYRNFALRLGGLGQVRRAELRDPITAFAVSLEQEPGLSEPRGPILLRGGLDS